MDTAGFRLDRRLRKIAVFADQAAANGKNEIGLSPFRKLEGHLALRDLKAIGVACGKAEKGVARLHDHGQNHHLR